MSGLDQMFAGFLEFVIEFFIDAMSFLSFIVIIFVCIAMLVSGVQRYFLRRKILRMLGETHGDFDFDQLVQKTGLDEDEVEEAIAELKRDGLVKEVE